MRALILALAIICAGCAGAKDTRRSIRASGTPVIREAPRLSERLRARPQAGAPRDGQATTELNGTIIR